MTKMQFEAEMKTAVADERKAANKVLEMIVEAQRRGHHLQCGYGSIFDWLVKVHKYTKGSAYRRVEAARLMNAVPEVAEKLESGSLSLSSLAKAQTMIHAQEKISGKMPVEVKAEIIHKIENLSCTEVERQLSILLPEVEIKSKNKFDDEAMALYDRVRDLLSHTIPNASMEEVFKYIAKDFLKRRDPLQKPQIERKASSSAANLTPVKSISGEQQVVGKKENRTSFASSEKKRTATQMLRRIIIQRAEGKCEWTDKDTGKRCGNTYQLEADHIIPWAMGGRTSLENLRCLCRSHNQHQARALGLIT